MLQFAPLAVLAATLLAASPLADTPRAPRGVATAQSGLDAITLGLQALEQEREDDDVCASPPPEGGDGSLAATAALMGCVTETVADGASRAAGLATALNGLFVLGASVPMMVGEATPQPDAAKASPLPTLR